MHITINTFGTQGDIQPFIALGLGFRAAGHEVRILTHAIFESFVREYDLDFHPIALDPRDVLIQQAIVEFGNNQFAVMRWLREGYSQTLAMLFRVTDQAAAGSDLLVNSTLSIAGYHVAHKHDLPTIAAYLQPSIPTRAFPGMSFPVLPGWFPLRGLYNFASTKLSNQMFFNLTLPLVNRCRADVLGLPSLTARYYWRIDTDGVTPLAFGYSPTVIPKPPDWGDNIAVCGYWFLDRVADYQPPPELVSFIERGSPPVYIGFGSMVDHEQAEVMRIITAALEIAGARAVLLGGWSRLGGENLPDTILALDYAPHEWLFPRMAAVVHHGGAGTTAAGLRAGVPTVVVPFFADQFLWGQRVFELGAGPRPIPRKKLTAPRLAQALIAATADPAMRARAGAVGAAIAAEDGVGQAVDWIVRRARPIPAA